MFVRCIAGAALAVLALGLSGAAQAQHNPSRVITLVVPIGAGGGVDATARMVAEKLQERLKQTVIVENRPAAGGMVGTASVAKATPDGHTILMMEASAVLHKWLRKDVPFDVVEDFAPVAQVAIAPIMLVAHPSFPPNTIKELIDHAKSRPGKLSVGIPGVGSPHHLALMMLNAMAKIDLMPVPYRGAAASMVDLLSGQIPMTWAAPTAVLPHVAAGKVKVLGVATPKRLPVLPNVPTIAEGGLPGFGVEVFFGIAAPAKTPPEVVARLERALAEITKMPDLQERIRRAGLTPTFRDSKAFAEVIRTDHERFGKVIREAGIKPQ